MPDKKILVVDDEEEFLGLVEKTLINEGYDVITATTAEEAINKARMSVPDLMLVDIMLPDKEGSDLVKVLRQDPKTDSIPAIFFSGIVTRDKSEEAATEITVGDRAYKALSKPFSSVELMTEVRKVIG